MDIRQSGAGQHGQHVLHPGEVRFKAADPEDVSSASGDPTVNAAVDPIAGGGNACATTSSASLSGTATYRLPKVAGKGYTLLGAPTVIADLRVKASTDAVNTELAARLWDVAPDGNQALVARALYRPTGDGRQVFQLHPNGWRFAGGHVPKLELLGNDTPYGRMSNFPFRITVSNLDVRLPTHDKPWATKQVVTPAAPILPKGATPTAEAAQAIKAAEKAKKR